MGRGAGADRRASGEIKAQYGPEAVVFGCATAAGTSAADFFPWVQRLANAFGSPNILFANHLCGWHRNDSLQYTYGVRMPQPDYDQARCILLWGTNPQASKPTDAMRISRAKARGARLIVIDPRKASVVDKAEVGATWPARRAPWWVESGSAAMPLTV